MANVSHEMDRQGEQSSNNDSAASPFTPRERLHTAKAMNIVLQLPTDDFVPVFGDGTEGTSLEALATWVGRQTDVAELPAKARVEILLMRAATVIRDYMELASF